MTIKSQEIQLQEEIPVFRPTYDEREVQAVRECLERGWTGCGPRVKAFEETFANYIGVKHAVAVNSCTAALHLALMSLIEEGDEVITTPITFVSTNHAILYNKGVPVFADVQAGTLNLDPDDVERKITPKTKGIIAVHFGGHACDMKRLREIASKHHLFILEDVAHGCGGEYGGQKLGTFGEIACFSFQAVKNLATGDGGMIVTNNEKIASQLHKMRWLGISKDTWDRNEAGRYSWDYDVVGVGLKYQMNDIAAAIGLVQLEKLEQMNEARAERAMVYDHAFRALREIEPLSTLENVKHARHNYVVYAERRDELMSFLKERGIATGVHYRPNHHYSVYKKFPAKVPVCDEVWQKIVTLPLYPALTSEQQKHVIDSIRAFYLL